MIRALALRALQISAPMFADVYCTARWWIQSLTPSKTAITVPTTCPLRSLDPKPRGRDQTPAVHRTGARAIGADGPPSASENTQLDASSHSHNCRRYYARACNAPKSHRQARPKLGTAPAIRSSVALASTSASGPRSRKNAAWVRWVPGQTHRFPTFSTFCSVMSTPASIVNVAEPVGQRRQFSSFFRSDRLIVSTALAHYHAWRSFQ